MASNLVSITRRGFGETMRKDWWWVQSALTFLGFGAFIVYSTWAAFQGEHYSFGPYLSPMYSPLIWEAAGQPLSGHAWLGAWPSWLPSSLLIQPITPAVLILWVPGGFTIYVLLLSRRLLQSVLGRPGCVCSRRTSQRLSGRKLVSADFAESSSIFSLRRAHLYFDSRL